jgi:hypothetical protein
VVLQSKYTRALNFEKFLQAMQLAALQQREQQADEVWRLIAGVSAQTRERARSLSSCLSSIKLSSSPPIPPWRASLISHTPHT